MFRNIVELSIMKNNDEIVFYTENKLSYDDPYIKRFSGGFYTPYLVLSREVHEIESDSLNFKYRGSLYDEKILDVTRLLDAYFKIKSTMQALGGVNPQLTSSWLLAHYVAYCYYDCMSGGCPHFELSILRYLCEHESIDQDERVYPGKEDEKWHTIKDFINEIKGHGVIDFAEVIKDARKKFPSFKLLGE